MSELGDKQERFSLMLSNLISFAYAIGYKIRMGEVYRPPVTAEYYASIGKGSRNSLHCDKLAVDIALFKNGEYLKDTHEYVDLGRYWEAQGGAWGGRWGDGNHFSIEYQGRK